MAITSKIVTITPGMASSWLADNKFDNRNLSDANVDRISRDIKKGKWVFDGNPIRFDESNNIIDGQHRLWAIVMAGKEVETMVIRGLSEQAKFTIDSGKSRSNADILHFAGHVNNSHLAAMCRLTLAYKENKGDLWKWAMSNSKKRLSTQELLEEANSNSSFPTIVNNATKLKYSKKILGTGTLAFSYYALLKVSDAQKEVEQFFVALENGTDLSLTNPILLLRNVLTLKETNYYYQDKGGNKATAYKVAILFKTWNAWRNGAVIKRLSFNTVKESYPIPE